MRTLSEKYFSILRRHNYVTPTSYLELILTFKKLLGTKRNEILTLKQRYTTGLERLEFAASQVSYDCTVHLNLYSPISLSFLHFPPLSPPLSSLKVSVMQQELTDLRPELIKTSEETAKLMVKIEKDTVEAEAKKEVSENDLNIDIDTDIDIDWYH